MRWTSTPFVLVVLVVLAVASSVASSGCGGSAATTMIVCDPACPAGTHCEETGCILNQEQPDDMSVRDFAAVCQPACAGGTPYCNEALQCVACLMDSHCPNGQVCRHAGATSLCVAGCSDDARCGGAPMLCCGGRCLDASGDPLNCGACGMACSAVHAASTCAGGTCQPGTCDPGWADCNADPGDGCEANLRLDPGSCGACGMKCAFPHSLAGCADTCYVQACEFGFDDCNGLADDGCETRVSADPKHCGACEIVCTNPPNATTACVNAACILKSCNGLFLDCDRNAQNGCEVDGRSDAKNCGACGNTCGQGLVCRGGGCTCPQCDIPNAVSKCVNNICVLDKCNPGFADCDNNDKNGCEADIGNDASNCGGCGMVCPMNQNVCFQATCTDVPKVPFFNSMPVRTGGSVRGADSSCGTGIMALQDVVVRSIAVSVMLNNDGNIKFMIFDRNNQLLFVSQPKRFVAGAGWRQSDPLGFTLKANTQYAIGGISDAGGTWDYDTVSEMMGGVRSLVTNPNFQSFANPAVVGTGGADCGIQLF